MSFKNLPLYSLILIALVALVCACSSNNNSSNPTAPAPVTVVVTPTATGTNTPCGFPGNTCTFTATTTATFTLSPTSTDTPVTILVTSTWTFTPTPTPTPTRTNTPTNTLSATPSSTPTNTPTFISTNTPTDTPSNTPTLTPTDTLTPTPTPTHGHPPTATSTSTNTGTPTGSPTPTPTLTPIPSGAWSLVATVTNWNHAEGVAAGVSFIAVSSPYGNVQVSNSAGTSLYLIPVTGYGLAIDSSNELYVCQNGGSHGWGVYGYILTPGGYTYDYFWNGQGVVKQPVGVKIDANGNLVVADASTRAVYNLLWNDDSILKKTTGGPATFYPYDVALDAGGNLYVAADYNGPSTILEYDSNYAYTSTLNISSWTTPLGSYELSSVAVDTAGNLYISDTNNQRVVYATAQGTYLGEIDGVGYPWYIYLNNSGDLFVASYYADRALVYFK